MIFGAAKDTGNIFHRTKNQMRRLRVGRITSRNVTNIWKPTVPFFVYFWHKFELCGNKIAAIWIWKKG